MGSLSAYSFTSSAVASTPIEYGGLQQAFDAFNAALFDGKLP